MDDHPHANILAALAAELHEAAGTVPTSRAVVTRTCVVLPAAEHVAVSVRPPGRRFAVLDASSDLARHLDGLQHEMGTGPCGLAAGEPGYVCCGDVAADPRWPDWGVRAARLGVRSVLSVGLRAESRWFGSLSAYSRTPDCFDEPGEIDGALLWASHVASALSRSQEVDGLRAGMVSRHEVGMAQGIVMERFGVGEEQSSQVLERLAASYGVDVTELARRVAVTGVLPQEAAGRLGEGGEAGEEGADAGRPAG